MSYERLIREHDEIDAAARRLEVAAQAETPDTAAVAGLLSELACAVDEHLRHEDRAVYSQLIANPDTSARAAPVDFEGMFEALRCDWQNYLSDWDADCLAADWPNFQAETAAIMARLRDRVREETDLIYPLALQRGMIALRDARR